ncbi:MAG: SDR family oxidoreductase [Paracoccus sp. (in: a-proteobacteria)]|uniref:SDR family oxidoreductase n=1 Tax=Paracoccus sp. TaxID=267 RepID=UPI0026DED063|nr:SDR family oxidoreductase [Paracoccus sp. (in: a-proteobacteria)]MDO5622144.1 SDR family oxidoreductase [Paracoccus sp. (in: a-proteobacteria)]
MIAITGASGQLGRLVIAALLDSQPADQIIAVVRNPDSVADLAAQGVQVRRADYSDQPALEAAFQGADKLLLISSSEVGQRAAQHRNVIAAAKAAGVGLLAYTSLLHADRSALLLAEEHRTTEAELAASGLPYVLLRNGWYTENYLAGLPAALEHGALIGAAGQGRIASATRADYAAAAAAVLTRPDQAGKTYELSGDSAYTLADFAAELSRQTGRQIPYVNMTQADYAAALAGAGIPQGFAEVLAQSDAAAADGGLFGDSGDLATLIGRPTTPLAEAMAAALR